MAGDQTTSQYGAPPSGGTASTNAPQPLGIPAPWTDTQGQPHSYQPPLTEQAGPAGPNGPLPGVNPFGKPANKHIYVEGEELGPAHEPRAQVMALQDALVKAGLLDPTSFHRGVWDQYSAAAFKIVLANANAYGASAPDMLNAMVSNPPARLKNQAPYGLANPIDTQAAYQSAASNLTGGALPQGQNAFTSWYNEQQANASKAYSNAASGAAYTDRPSMDAAAKEYILAHNQQDVVNYDLALRTMQFHDALKEL